MKNIFFLLLFLPALLLAGEINPKLQPKKVVVYIQGAQIINKTTFSVPEGRTSILFSDLSPNITPNSIQVSGLGDVSIAAINYRINYLKKESETEKLKSLKALLDVKERKSILITNKIGALQQEEALLTKNMQINTEHQSAPISKLKEYAAYYRNRIAGIRTEIYDANRNQIPLQKEISDLQREINKHESLNAERRGEIELLLDAPLQTSLNLLVTFNVSEAAWRPTYDIKTDNSEDPLLFTYKANVYQQTGNDWDNVELTLSTGNPSLNTEKPIVYPYYLNFRRNTVITGQALEQEVVMAMGVKRQSALEKMAPKKIPVMVKTENMTSTQFNIAKKYSIPSSSETTAVMIDEFSIPATYEYYAAPLLNPKVFLTAKVTDWENFDILPGNAKIYFDGSFAGTTTLHPQQTDKEMVISLGVDADIAVKREKINNLKDKSFFGNTRIIKRNYVINLKNNKARSIEITLVDRVPISQNSEIKVEDLDYDHAKYNLNTGVITWKLNLKPKEMTKLEFSYEIKYPKDRTINLN